MSENDIRRFSRDELRARHQHEGIKSDLDAARRITGAELEAAIASDPGEAGLPRDWWKNAIPVTPGPKTLLSLRLDPDVVEFFRGEGKGYQTRMNAVLRAYMVARRGQAG